MQLKTRAAAKLWVTVWMLTYLHLDVSATQNISDIFKGFNSFKSCIGNKHPIVCVKEKALDVLNETIMSDEPMNLFEVLTIERNPDYVPNATEEENLPEEVSKRSMKLTDILYDRIEDFFKSRTLKVNLAPTFEGRKKGGGGKGKGGMMMMGMIGMGCMVAQMMMGKVAFLAGSALIIAKVALFLAAISLFKKMSGGGGGGGETAHVVYAAPAGGGGGGGGGGDYGHSHGGGGGWHRSLDADSSKIAYAAQITESNINGY